MKLHIVLVYCLLLSFSPLLGVDYLEVLPQNGDGLQTVFQRYRLDYNDQTIAIFKSLNESKFGSNNSLLLGVKYQLPIKEYNYNSTSIRSTIGNQDYEYAVNLQDYNDLMFSKGVKPNNYRLDKKLWVPEIEFYLSSNKSVHSITDQKQSNELKTFIEPLFGENNKNVIEISHKLRGNVYYLVGGHGGPDPGAIGKRNGNTLHEDEYAYDVILRLAKNLMEHGATVKIIVQDPGDGIRDDMYLNNSFDEIYYGNQDIPRKQLARLKKRVDIINDEFYKNKKTAKEQIVVPIHVDSRENKNKRIDIFFYHNQSSERGQVIANTLLETLEDKYRAAQPGRGYNGSVSARGLYMLRNTVPVTVYIELGNIQNDRDQIRLVERNNRQAIANWLTDGFIKLAKK